MLVHLVLLLVNTIAIANVAPRLELATTPENISKPLAVTFLTAEIQA
jgi:hypothetical protein